MSSRSSSSQGEGYGHRPETWYGQCWQRNAGARGQAGSQSGSGRRVQVTGTAGSTPRSAQQNRIGAGKGEAVGVAMALDRLCLVAIPVKRASYDVSPLRGLFGPTLPW